eukprot:jgi/Chlat1/3093/Chrsp21S08798
MAPNLNVPDLRPASDGAQAIASPPSGSWRRAYVTLLTGEDYLPGVLALKRSLTQTRSLYPLLCMITPGVTAETRHQMEEAGVGVLEVQQFIPVPKEDLARLNYKVASFLDCWLKLRLWEMEKYETVVYIDADMITVQNTDDLFDIPFPDDGLLATLDCWCGRPVDGDRCPFLCSKAPAATSGTIMDPIAYSKKGGAHINGKRANGYFNAGLMVLKPGRATFEDFLNEYYANRWAALPYTYNGMKLLPHFHKDMWSTPDLKVIHYVLALNPRHQSASDYHLALASLLTNEKSTNDMMNAIKHAELDGIVTKLLLQLYVRWWATMAGAV